MSKGSARTTEWRKLRLTILDRDHHTCAYCGAEATEVDHIQARANGGQDTPDNLVASCRTCNATKQDKPLVRTNWYNKAWITKL
jgi:5-methylcytosine-specific restriction endonuclease McrA